VSWIPLENKYKTKCKTCGYQIEVGVKVLWQKGSGVKHESCEIKSIISEKEWADFQQYQYKELHLISKCQRCAKSLAGLTDIYINNDRRTCSDCFGS
jgi:hypothetical protein